jgi:hypothetical protein
MITTTIIIITMISFRRVGKGAGHALIARHANGAAPCPRGGGVRAQPLTAWERRCVVPWERIERVARAHSPSQTGVNALVAHPTSWALT